MDVSDRFTISINRLPSSQSKCNLSTNSKPVSPINTKKKKYNRKKFPLRHKRQLFIIKLVPGPTGNSHFLIYDSVTQKRLSIQDIRLNLSNKRPGRKRCNILMGYIYQISSILRDMVQNGTDNETRFIRNGYSIYNMDTFDNVYRYLLSSHRGKDPPKEENSNSITENHTIRMPSRISKRFRSLDNHYITKLKNLFPLELIKSAIPKNKLQLNFQHKFLFKSKSVNSTLSNESRIVENDNAGPKRNRGIKSVCNWSFIALAFQFIIKAFHTLFPSITLISMSTVIIILQWAFYYMRKFLRGKKNVSFLFMHFSGNKLRNNEAVYSLITSTLLHSSLGHLLVSTIMHFRFSFVMESTHGSILTLIMYFICSIYGMLSTCWYNASVKQANGFSGDFGVGGILISGYLFNIYSPQSGEHYLTDFIISWICLLFVKASDHGDQISLYTHLMSSVCGFCFGYLFSRNSSRGKRASLTTTIICDIICLAILVIMPAASLIALFVFDL